jgi:hypothetical protein
MCINATLMNQYIQTSCVSMQPSWINTFNPCNSYKAIHSTLINTFDSVSIPSSANWNKQLFTMSLTPFIREEKFLLYTLIATFSTKFCTKCIFFTFLATVALHGNLIFVDPLSSGKKNSCCTL